MKAFDLLVIGGGVNGTGIARDAAMRGLSVCLVEKKDFAAGASGANTGMIHGGARYLLHDAKVTRLSCLDSGYIQHIAPHLLFRIPFLIPLLPSGHELFDSAYAYGVECYFEEYDRYQPLKNGKPHTRLTDAELHELEPGIVENTQGAVTMDEYGIDPFRLCTLNARSAADHGAEVRTHSQVTRLDRGWQVELNGSESVRASVVFNAAGPWAPRVAALAGFELRIRPGKGVHVTLDRRLSNYGIICKAIDGRDVFVMPHEDSSIVGTTDDDFYGDPDELTVSRDEIEYLLTAVERTFPVVRQARVLRAWAGVRPTLFQYGPLEDRLSRDHRITHHGDGFYSIVGGKLASFRAMAEEAVDEVAARLAKGARCETHRRPLPGGEAAPPSAEELSQKYDVPAFAAARLAYRHGAEAAQVLQLADERPELRALCCPCEGVTFAELEFSRAREYAPSLLDLRRRCRLAMGVCQGARCIGPAAALLEDLDEARALLDERWKGQRPVLAGDGLAQAELMQAAYFGSGALGRTEAPWR